jgi:hypothetical protein
MQNERHEPAFVPAGPKRMPATLLEFAKPLLDRLPLDETVDESLATLQFAAAVASAQTPAAAPRRPSDDRLPTARVVGVGMESSTTRSNTRRRRCARSDAPRFVYLRA